MECIICVEKILKKIICEKCDNIFCVSCFEKCMLQNPGVCPNCNEIIYYLTLKKYLSSKFLSGPYKAAKIEQIWSNEGIKLSIASNKENHSNNKKKKQLLFSATKHWIDFYKIASKIENSSETCDKMRDLFLIMNPNLYAFTYTCTECGLGLDKNGDCYDCVDTDASYDIFAKNCSKCDGKIINQICNRCANVTCSSCEKDKEINHICNEADILSKVFLDETTKPCPNCNISISKIMGCNQMYCVECKHKFDWKSGKEIKSSHFHNPHYFEDNDTMSIYEKSDGHLNINGRSTDLRTVWFYSSSNRLKKRIGFDKIRTECARGKITKDRMLEKMYEKQRKDEIDIQAIIAFSESRDKIKYIRDEYAKYRRDLCDSNSILLQDISDDLEYELYILREKLKKISLSAASKRFLIRTDMNY